MPEVADVERKIVLGKKIPALGSVARQTCVVARAGNGRLETIDGTRVLFVKGTPEEMGWRQGTLMNEDIRNLVNRILYGVGVGSSFVKGRSRINVTYAKWTRWPTLPEFRVKKSD